jgi:hypothetical protein
MSILLQIRIRRDTSANWTAQNPILGSGELGLDTTLNILKVGDGTTAWSTLPAVVGGSGGASDHGTLSGLLDDDHPQYLTQGRGDLRYSLLGHTHGTGSILDNAITYAKLQNTTAASVLLGRGSTAAGDPQEITLGTGLTMTNTTVSVNGLAPQRVYVRNTTGATLPKGAAVYISGASGQTPLVALARANAYGTVEVIGVIDAAISNNGFGYAVSFGLLEGLDTSTLTQGNSVYLSPTVAGGLTTTEPESPNFQIQIGWCEYQHQNNGKLLVRINPEFTKAEYIADSTAIGRGVITAATTEQARIAIGLGTASTKDTPSSGNASSTQVVLGSDTRLTDSRTPLAHTHVSADVTNFSTSVDTIVSSSALDGGSF